MSLSLKYVIFFDITSIPIFESIYSIHKKSGQRPSDNGLLASCVLAYPSFSHIKAMQNGKVGPRNFLWQKNSPFFTEKVSNGYSFLFIRLSSKDQNP